jgi:hypothetical protein
MDSFHDFSSYSYNNFNEEVALQGDTGICMDNNERGMKESTIMVAWITHQQIAG